MNAFQRAAKLANTVFAPLLSAPVLGPVLSRSMAEISYVGRKSGRPITLIVSYRRKGDDVVLIGVAAADQKTWWRNFYPDGAPITVHLDGRDRTGFAVARRDERGTSVKVTLD
ncbi:hypothetical protein GOARA_068_00730 [Gordonia araii NBRC 100433]|uniref:Nitroreductase family deazaflavin-dependent oxidoreductase n=1 Tax=Gordonia araii NBRC 100433 TaxID=1073574 RepID=G7H6D9_9ACTN|nr:hypothetical protein [Gordonia araii]NNG96094.1 hypothetical protein [Gordonia araii NBRC 100433]GAB11414.1 hypothetical protein GOARA_068_00730 [Gordonia araii NBRC 100433]